MIFENDEYRAGRQQAENGVYRCTWLGGMSRDEIQGYDDEMARQRRRQEESDALWATAAASHSGGHGGGDIPILPALCAVLVVADFVIRYWLQLLVSLAVGASVAAIVWWLIQVPKSTWIRILTQGVQCGHLALTWSHQLARKAIRRVTQLRRQG